MRHDPSLPPAPEAGNADQYDITRLTPLPDSPLRGRTVFFLGSSVTNGAASQHQALPEYFAARLGCRSIKEAVDGTTLANDAPDSYIQRLLPHLDREAVDLFVCQLSTNDAGQHKPLGRPPPAPTRRTLTPALSPAPSSGSSPLWGGDGTARWSFTPTPALTAPPTTPWSGG